MSLESVPMLCTMAAVRRFSRRTFLAAAGTMVAAAACSTGKATGPGERLTTPMLAGDGLLGTPTPTVVRPTFAPTATATPVPVRGRGMQQRLLMADTPWATSLSIRSSGVRGPAVMILGGVHGNEPGGWLAADTVAEWIPSAGDAYRAPAS